MTFYWGEGSLSSRDSRCGGGFRSRRSLGLRVGGSTSARVLRLGTAAARHDWLHDALCCLVARDNGAGEDVCGVFGGRDGGQVAPNGPDRFIDGARQSAAIDQALYGADYGVISQFVSPA